VSRLRALALIAALLAGCGAETPPPLPSLEALVPEQALPPVREQIRAAWEAARSAPRDAAASGGLGMVLSAYGQSEPARLCYRRAGLLDPGEFRWPYYEAISLHYEAISLRDLGRLDEAVARMEQALAIAPKHPEGRLRLGDWRAATGDPAGALARYRSVVADAPGRADARLRLGRLLLDRGDPEAAATQLRAALEADWRVGEVHYVLSRALRALGDSGAAQQHALLFQRFQGRRLHLADPLVRQVAELDLSDKPHLTRAAWHREQGRPEQAAEALTRALAVNPGNAAARMDLMQALAEVGHMAAAKDQYLEAVAALPEDPTPHERWGRLCLRDLDYPGAAAAFKQALDLGGEQPDLLADLGLSLERQDDRPGASGAYRHALALAPGHPEANAGLGRLLLASGETAEALPYLERAAAAPGTGRARRLHRLALAQAELGQPDAARRSLVQARPLAVAGVDPGLSRDIDVALRTLQLTEPETL
jgi:tetratricopeptide (TPR) repeat protein